MARKTEVITTGHMVYEMDYRNSEIKWETQSKYDEKYAE